MSHRALLKKRYHLLFVYLALFQKDWMVVKHRSIPVTWYDCLTTANKN